MTFFDNDITERNPVLNSKWRATQNTKTTTILQIKIMIEKWLHETDTWWKKVSVSFHFIRRSKIMNQGCEFLTLRFELETVLILILHINASTYTSLIVSTQHWKWIPKTSIWLEVGPENWNQLISQLLEPFS